MSVSDRKLPWWREENKPDGIRCDRNGCDATATVRVRWRGDGDSSSAGYRACQRHGDWWVGSPFVSGYLMPYTPVSR